MRVLFGLIAFAIVAVAACTSTSIPSSRMLGVLNIANAAETAGVTYGKPTGVFWEASNVQLPYSLNAPDSCLDTLYFAPDTTPATLYNQLDAGSPIAVQTSLGTDQLVPDTISGKLITYRNKTASIPYATGASMTFTVPGGASGGFPAMSTTATLAKRLVLGTIDPQPADSLHLTWGIGQPGTAVVNIYLLYSSVGLTKPNRVVKCALYDDGEFWVNAKLAAKWKIGYGSYQSVNAYRWLTTYTNGPSDALLLTISEWDTVKTTFP